jgi:Na+-transporting NADH:ubiquinone oxidoreductase subunit A
MKRIEIKKGLDVPVTGEPQQTIKDANPATRVALLGDDYIGMKPTMEVAVGDRVKTGQLLFTDKRNQGVKFTSPGTGTVSAINRGPKRKFESIVIDLDEDEHISFCVPGENAQTTRQSDEIRSTLIESGVWCSFRTRPFGKIPSIKSTPAALFITATDTLPLAADPAVVIDEYKDEFLLGLDILENFTESPIYLCIKDSAEIPSRNEGKIENVEFHGPHPAGLPSTHIHFLDSAKESKVAWHLGYNDVISIGHLFLTGHLITEKVVSLAGPAVLKPQLIKTRPGAEISEICVGELISSPIRILSGSILDGRQAKGFHQFVGRYHNQISALHEGSGRSFFSWALPGGDRFSLKPVFTSALDRARKFAMNTALWGGERAIFPLDSYEKVMPLDIIPLALLKSLAIGDTENARNLGCLELIEEDLALCTFVCPGKNNFGPMLRDVLTEIELEG